ncbi:hypothetical protein ACP70R_044077 [Stipagrostis hirtigluma subsp. patula]
MDTDGAVLMVIKDVKSKRLLPTRLDLVAVDEGATGARVVDPATSREAMVHGPVHDVFPMADADGFVLPFTSCRSSFGRATPSGACKAVHICDVTSPHAGQRCQIATVENSGTAPAWRGGRPAPPFRTCYCSRCTATVNGVLHFKPYGVAVDSGLEPHCLFRPGERGVEDDDRRPGDRVPNGG